MGAPGPPPPQYSLPPASGGSLPGWLGPVVTLTTQVGVPTVVAGVLLWFVLARVDGTLKMIQEEEDTRTKLVLAMQDTLIATLDKLGQRFEQAIDANIKANRDLAAQYDKQSRER